jgi:hypothetical protein
MQKSESEFNCDEFEQTSGEPMPGADDGGTGDFDDIELSGYHEISEGLSPNAPRLKLKINQKAVLRLLPFGNPPRPLSLIGKHLVYQLGVVGCPRVTDPALGGNRSTECPLCNMVKADSFPQYLTPALKFEIWAYALVLSIDEGSGWVAADLQTINKPRRLQFLGDSGLSLMLGTNIMVSAVSTDNWRLDLGEIMPIRLNSDPLKEMQQWRQINRLLGEPHMWVERNPRPMYQPQSSEPRPVGSEETLRFAAAYLKAHYQAPKRSEDRFWSDMINLSKPALKLQYK